jgi:hypothetical protein
MILCPWGKINFCPLLPRHAMTSQFSNFHISSPRNFQRSKKRLDDKGQILIFILTSILNLGANRSYSFLAWYLAWPCSLDCQIPFDFGICSFVKSLLPTYQWRLYQKLHVMGTRRESRASSVGRSPTPPRADHGISNNKVQERHPLSPLLSPTVPHLRHCL